MGLLKGLLSSKQSMSKTFNQITTESTEVPLKQKDFYSLIEVTEEYKLVNNFIKKGEKLIFVTGGAGTGKSTFVKWIQEIYVGEVVTAAPTGIAALTVSGSTIHRLFKFPPAWIIDDDIKRDSKSVIAKAKILILDEISMVNANMLDAIDKSCRLHRDAKKPFGGLTLIMVGDLFQLPPIVTGQTKNLFRREYKTPNFFSAHSLSDLSPVGVELLKPFRQKDTFFINLLQNIREGNDLRNTIKVLNSECLITKRPPNGAVHLAPTNKEVEEINKRRLSAIKSPEWSYLATQSGKFSESQLPAPSKTTLKKGAQIVFLNNSKSWVNGSVGLINELSKNKILVNLSGTNKKVEVLPYQWENYEYFFNEETNKIDRRVIGRYEQFPITLAWAMTIHKSQGLTLDRVHLSLGAGAFENGQTYVALSRCRDLNSLTLERKIEFGDILVDQEVVNFYKVIRS